MPTRVLNWDVEATHWACEQLGKPYVWGKTDCASLVRGLCRAMYGEELWPDVPTYVSITSALAACASYGSVKQRLEQIGSITLPSPRYATTGDILVAPAECDCDPFELVMPVITDKYLCTARGETVHTIPLRLAPDNAITYRIPYER